MQFWTPEITSYISFIYDINCSTFNHAIIPNTIQYEYFCLESELQLVLSLPLYYLTRLFVPMLCRSWRAMDRLVVAAGYNELFINLISSDDMKGVPLLMSIKQTDIQFTIATMITSEMYVLAELLTLIRSQK